MPPSLPQFATDPKRRDRQLAEAREDYVFDRSYRGFIFAAKVPWQDRLDARYIAAAAQNKLEVAANRAASRLSSWADDEVHELRGTVRNLLSSMDPRELVHALANADRPLRLRERREHPVPIDDYADLFPILPKPASMQLWREDWYFAWQRVAGCNPILIERAARVPDHFPVTDADLMRAFTGTHALAGDTLEAAGAEGRLYLVDYAMMNGVTLGQTDGRQKFLGAPISLYLRSKASARLLPVAIQCGQTPGTDTPIYTPADGVAWQMAKTVVQIADANFQGVIAHLGYCHLLMESVIIAARRELAEDHPLSVLLTPHFEYTLAVNQIAREQLVNPNGNMDRLQSGTLTASTALVQRSLSEYAFCQTDAPTAFAARGVDDVQALPEYPFRDDALSSWAPLLAFVRAYVQLYYTDPSEVEHDHELQAWVREMADSRAGNIHRVTETGRVETVDDVVMLIARVLYTCTIYHAGINYPSYDFIAYPPNMSAAAWAEGPGPGRDASELALASMMAPLDVSFETIALMSSISVQHNRLGEYPHRHFEDPRVAGPLAKFQQDLRAVEAQIQQRNGQRPLAYSYLLPSNITASIHV